ncbi:MAG: helix-turn-helix domain-containing protein [Phycisphaerae bacterium]
MRHRSYQELRARMTPRQRKMAEAQAKEMMAEMLLAEIRRSVGLTQQELARSLGVTQPSLSKLEKQDDMQISTLRRVVEALGGRLEVIAHLPNGDIRICQFTRSH